MLRPRVSTGILVLALTLASAGALSQAATDEELAVIVSAKNPVNSLSRDQLEALFTLSRQRWPHGDTVIVLNLEAGTSARVQFDRVVLGMTPDEAARYWIDRRIRGRGNPPTKAPNAATLLKAVAALGGAVGYVPKSQLGPGVKVVARVTRDQVIPETQGSSR
jgi:ABC-type phosphate transport system substrate-binding protein